jgi:hypothetical protein
MMKADIQLPDVQMSLQHMWQFVPAEGQLSALLLGTFSKLL